MEYTTSDIEYLRHGSRGLTARVYRPKGDGPFPAVVDVHGGAWTGGDLTDGEERDRALAAAGFLVAALEFRHGEDGYPTSLADINFAIRWLKSGASGLPVRADRVGLTGNSSGGHLAMLTAMRPSDPRYAALPVSGGKQADARVQCVAMLWPVINPLSRYRHARRARDTANPPAWVGNIPERQETYWKSEAAMEEGNPMMALERGEAVQTPPAIWVQGRPSDPPHDYHDPDGGFAGNEPERFVANYRKRGGQIELVDVDQAARGSESVAPVVAFFRKHLVG